MILRNVGNHSLENLNPQRHCCEVTDVSGDIKALVLSWNSLTLSIKVLRSYETSVTTRHRKYNTPRIEFSTTLLWEAQISKFSTRLVRTVLLITCHEQLHAFFFLCNSGKTIYLSQWKKFQSNAAMMYETRILSPIQFSVNVTFCKIIIKKMSATYNPVIRHCVLKNWQQSSKNSRTLPVSLMVENNEVKHVTVWIYVVYIEHICLKYNWRH